MKDCFGWVGLVEGAARREPALEVNTSRGPGTVLHHRDYNGNIEYYVFNSGSRSKGERRLLRRK